MKSELEVAIAMLERRVGVLEDRAAIAEAMASYGLAADAGLAEAVAALWTDQGRYDAGIVAFDGREQIAGMVEGVPHRDFTGRGAAHIVSAPRIRIDGDEAVSFAYQQVLLRDAEREDYRVWRISANRWEWLRTPEGWRVTRRINRLLDGTSEAIELFRSAFGDAPDVRPDITHHSPQKEHR